MCRAEPAILSLVNEAIVTKFAHSVAHAETATGALFSVVLFSPRFGLTFANNSAANGRSTNNTTKGGTFLFSLSIFFGLRWEDQPSPSPPRKTFVPWIFIGVPTLLLLLPIRLFEIGTPE